MKKLSYILVPLLMLTSSCQTTKISGTSTYIDGKTMQSQKDKFCIDLIAQSIAENDNAFISPISAAMALHMLTPGAEGATRDELEKVIPQYSLSSSEQLQIASAIWINQGLNVKNSFLDANKDAEVYHGRITTKRVNQWASNHTRGKINAILQDPLPPIRMILTNALYFKADWAEPFRSVATQKKTFYGSKGETTIDMMHQTEHFQYIENNTLQAIRLHYTSPYYMDIYLPKRGYSLKDILPDIMSIKLSEAEEKKVNLALPKIQMQYEKQLNDYLKRMGLQTCFTAQADFSGISISPLFVDFVKQNTYLSIDEAGTEAAAVTSIGLAKMAYRPAPEEVFDMKINRPFLLLIRDRLNDQVIFYGVIQNL